MAQLDTHSVFIVSGGAKGITSFCVIKLASLFHCRFILVGRSPHNPEPEWAQGVLDDSALKRQALNYLDHTGETATPRRLQALVKDVQSSREIQSTLNSIHKAGGKARYIAVDVTDKDALEDAVKKAEAIIGKVTGCIHGAGVLADKHIQHKTASDIDRVIGVKLHGLKNLLEIIPPERLLYLVLFSSVAGFYGNIGQSDYAAANEILNKVAHQVHFRYPKCRVVALDWGPWDGGMVNPSLRALLIERKVPIIPIEVGTDILVNAMTTKDPAPQYVVGGEMSRVPPTITPSLKFYKLHKQLMLQKNPFLLDHVIGGHAVLPTVCAVAWAANACEQLYPGYTFYSVHDYRVLKGIVFDETLAPDYLLELHEVEKSEEKGIVMGAIISSRTATGQPRFHYKMSINIRREIPDPPVLSTFNNMEMQPMQGIALYESGALFHGSSFRGIAKVLNHSPDRMTLICEPPKVSLHEQGQFQVQTFNPFATDVQLQSLLVWAHHYLGYGGLPLSIEHGVQFRPVSEKGHSYVFLEVKAATKHRLVADVFVSDASGVLFSKVTGAEITLSDRLNILFTQNQLRVRV